jgi:glycosyltransferase involved in cell wall biosynthesis
MGLASEIGVLIITYNEESNVARTLARLDWARRILVVDSGSTDATLEIIHRCPQAATLHRPFDNFAAQCNFGLSHMESEWVLSLDADYELSDALIGELHRLEPADAVSGYRARFDYCVYGHALRGTLYPPRIVLYRKSRARYRNEGHGHRVSVEGTVLPLSGSIRHDDRKPLSRWFAAQQRYAREEAEYLVAATREHLTLADRLRLMAWPAPILVMPYVLFIKGCLLDGWSGWFYALQRMCAEIMIALELIDRRLRRSRPRRN